MRNASDHRSTGLRPLDREGVDWLWLITALAGGVLLIVAATLLPVRFNPVGLGEQQPGASGFNWSLLSSGGLADFAGNVLLFVPAAFGLGAFLRRREVAPARILSLTVGLSLVVSAGIEFLQRVMLPGRDPALADVLANTVGGAVGCVCVFVGGRGIIGALSALTCDANGRLAPRKIVAAFIGYAIPVVGLSAFLAGLPALRNWDAGMPLLVGNEQTGDRPWQGTVHNLLIADRVLGHDEIERMMADPDRMVRSHPSLVAFYPLQAGRPLRDLTGNLPDLENVVPMGHAAEAPATWLSSLAAGERVTARLRETSQFTISAVIATADVRQGGPARIVSLSRDPWSRNLTIGQEGSDLVVRLRTPFTGPNGTSPQVHVPGALVDGRPRTMTCTFDGRVLRCAVAGGTSAMVNFSPELGLVRSLVSPQAWSATFDDPWVRLWGPLYWAVSLVPLAMLGGLLANAAHVRLRRRLAAVALMALAPLAAQDLSLALVQHHPVSIDQLVWGLSGSVATTVLCALWIAMARIDWSGIAHVAFPILATRPAVE